MRLVEFSIRRPVSVFIFSVAAIVFGVVAFGKLATDLLPDISYPSVTVQTSIEGAAPQEVETLLSRPIENAVGVVNNVVQVSSSSRAEISEVTLELAWGTNMDLAALDVRERLDLLQLPLEADRPILLRYDPSFDPILRLGLSGGGDLVHLRRVAEERVERALERIEGVAAVVVSGGLEEEIVVEIDEAKLAALNLEVDRVIALLASENVNLTGGRLREGSSEYLVRTVNEVLRPEELEEIVVLSRDGAIVRLADVARIVRSQKDRELISRVDGRESVDVAIYKEGGTNTVLVSDAVHSSIEDLEAHLQQLDPTLELTVISDQARYIRQSVNEVLRTAGVGGLLAIGVLFLFLRSWKTTLIIGIAIPISVVATFFLMFIFGISLNIMSLGGLTLGIGLLVDNAIVVLEAIQRRRDLGLDEIDAAAKGTAEVGRAVVASTLTTICVFVPILFVEGVAGQLFGDQALTITFSLSISLIVALTLIPMLASRGGLSSTGPADRFEDPGPIGRLAAVVLMPPLRLSVFLIGGVANGLNAVTQVPASIFAVLLAGISSAYRRLLSMALARPLVTVVVSLSIFAASLSLVPKLGRELVPEMVQGELFVDIELPPGSRLELTEIRLQALERAALELDGVEAVWSTVGASAERGGLAGERRENIGQLGLRVAPPVNRLLEERIIADLREVVAGLPAVEARFGRPAYFSFRTPVEVKIRGDNLLVLENLADQALARMETIPGLSDLRTSTEGGQPELEIRFDRERMARLGLSFAQVAPRIRARVQGTIASELQRSDRVIDIRVRASEDLRDSIEDLERLVVHQTEHATIPLSSVASVREVEGPAEIRRTEGHRVALITANLSGVDLGSANEAIKASLASLSFPQGYDWDVGGQGEEMATSFDSMKLAIGLAIFMVYLVMASQFESLLHPFVILFSVPLALIGVLVALYLSETSISVVALIGTILLAGIVVNNAILLVDAANRFRREEGMSTTEALMEAGSIRLRPILMTTATTVLGLLPMAFGLGEGAELRQPMALAVVGGLLSSTALTLVFVPALYRLLDRRKILAPTALD